MLTLVRGLPGSGKSTYAGEQARKAGGAVFEADLYMVNEKGEYAFDHTRLTECHNKCQSMTRLALEHGLDTWVSNTFVKQLEMAPYIEMAKELGVPVTIYVCKGQWQSVHGVPDDVMTRMAEGWEE